MAYHRHGSIAGERDNVGTDSRQDFVKPSGLAPRRRQGVFPAHGRLIRAQVCCRCDSDLGKRWLVPGAWAVEGIMRALVQPAIIEALDVREHGRR
jgi:hypothetical protein